MNYLLAFRAFSEDVMRTINKNLDENQHAICSVMGIAGEAGELLDYFKKHFFQGHHFDKEKVIDELGDIMFYITYLCELYCIDMGEVMYKNIEKRKQRYPQGFDSTRSKNRE